MLDARTILTHRSLTEGRLRDLLDESESALTLEAVKKLVFEAEAADFPRFVLAMAMALNCRDIDDLDAVALQVIQDAWNYFPHRELEGRSPAELMAENSRPAAKRRSGTPQDDVFKRYDV